MLNNVDENIGKLLNTHGNLDKNTLIVLHQITEAFTVSSADSVKKSKGMLEGDYGV